MHRLIIVCLLASFALGLRADPLRVVSSIKPLQLLVSAVGGDEVDSRVLLPPGFSPHDAQLKPSQWQLLEQADVLVWIGPALERFLVSALRGRDNALALQPAADLDDPHLWMSVDRVADMAAQIGEQLAQRQPDKRALFAGNAARLAAALRQQDSSLREAFSKARPVYLLPHNGYSHFERQYGLQAAAVLSPNDEQLPGTAHIAALRERLLQGEFDCVFREPQQASRLTARLLAGVDVEVVPLDPMAADVATGSLGFERYYRELGEAFLACQHAGRTKLTKSK